VPIKHLGLIGVMVLAMAPVPAQAQQETFQDNVKAVIRRVGIHAKLSLRKFVDPDVTKGTTIGPSVGLGPGRTGGWKYPVGFTTFRDHLQTANGEPFAVLKSKTILAGVGYSWHSGRLSTGVSLQAGYAFNNGRVQGDMERAFAVPNDTVSIDVANALLLRPQVKAEYFITPKFSIRVAGDYVLMRPQATVTTPTERIVNRWDASNVHAHVNVGWYPFR
jgi:hypothetical protein